MTKLRRLLWLLLVVGTFLQTPHAEGRRNGAAFSGCEGCHGSTDDPPTFSLDSEPAVFDPGDTVTLILTIRDPQMASAGFYITTTEGQLSTLPGENTRMLGTNIGHDNPIGASTGVATVRMRWAAPGDPGGTDFTIYGLAANGNDSRTGDRPGRGSASLVYGCSGTVFYKDLDRDGYGSSDYGTTKDCAVREGWAERDGDCNENNADIFPNQVEVCNERDDDCDGQIDEGTSPRPLYPDEDGDGFGAPRDVIMGCVPPRGYTGEGGDCNDNDPMIHPEAVEVCNGFDDNCNRRTDENVRDRCGVGLCERYAVSCFSDECYPGEPFPEQCNGLDDDCDGVIDNGAECPVGQECYMFQCIDSADAEMLEAMPDEGASVMMTDNPFVQSASNPDTQAASAARVPASSDSGGCAVSREPKGNSAWFGLLGLTLLSARRRRRKR